MGRADECAVSPPKVLNIARRSGRSTYDLTIQRFNASTLNQWHCRATMLIEHDSEHKTAKGLRLHRFVQLWPVPTGGDRVGAGAKLPGLRDRHPGRLLDR